MLANSVSTIIPVYNRPKQIRIAVKSVLAQTYRPIEVIIVDDGSTDSTPNVVAELAAESVDIIRVFRQDNLGAAIARSRGFAESQGEYIQYLDSDDELTPVKFAVQVEALNSHPSAGVCYGVTRRRNRETGVEVDWARTGEDIDNIFPSFLMQRGWDTNSPLWRRSVCETIGPWGNYSVNEDWEHDLRAGMVGVIPCRVRDIVAIVNDHGEARASGMTSGFTPKIVEGMFKSHRSIWKRMRMLGLTDWAYLEKFSRKMFWIARLCGEHGLTSHADDALRMAMEMVSTDRSCWKLKTYRSIANRFGWQRTVRLSERARQCLLRVRGRT